MAIRPAQKVIMAEAIRKRQAVESNRLSIPRKIPGVEEQVSRPVLPDQLVDRSNSSSYWPSQGGRTLDREANAPTATIPNSGSKVEVKKLQKEHTFLLQELAGDHGRSARALCREGTSSSRRMHACASSVLSAVSMDSRLNHAIAEKGGDARQQLLGLRSQLKKIDEQIARKQAASTKTGGGGGTRPRFGYGAGYALGDQDPLSFHTQVKGSSSGYGDSGFRIGYGANAIERR
jgi:hypothetical protein